MNDKNDNILLYLTEIEPGKWMIIDFRVDGGNEGLRRFFSTLDSLTVDIAKEDFPSKSGKYRIHLENRNVENPFVNYEVIDGRLMIKGLLLGGGVPVEIPDAIVFVINPGSKRTFISAGSQPIVMPYFVKLLKKISLEFPETVMDIEEYILRVTRVAQSFADGENYSKVRTKGKPDHIKHQPRPNTELQHKRIWFFDQKYTREDSRGTDWDNDNPKREDVIEYLKSKGIVCGEKTLSNARAEGREKHWDYDVICKEKGIDVETENNNDDELKKGDKEYLRQYSY